MLTTKSISTALKKILADIAGIINIEYFREHIGRTHSLYLLVYLFGLIICQRNYSLTYIEQLIGICRHDSLLRMLNGINLTSKMLSGIFTAWIIANRKQAGWLCLDDTAIEKEYSESIECAGFIWSSSLDRSVMGINVVALYWTDGKIKIPIGFRIHTPKKKTVNYRTKVELAIELLVSNEAFCKTCSYLAFDSWYCSKRIMTVCSLMGIHCSSQLKKNRLVVFNGRKMAVSVLPTRFCQVNLPGYGEVLVYRDYCTDSPRYLMSTETFLSAKGVKRKYDNRWRIEESFRYMKQNLGLCRCQCRKKSPVKAHISLVFLAHFTMEVMACRLGKNPYECSMIILCDYMNPGRKPSNLSRNKALLRSIVK